MANQANGSARTFVTLAQGQVFGYYSLAAASVEHAAVPQHVSKGLARHTLSPCCWHGWQWICGLKADDFEPSPVDATHLYLLTQDIRKTLA